MEGGMRLLESAVRAAKSRADEAQPALADVLMERASGGPSGSRKYAERRLKVREGAGGDFVSTLWWSSTCLSGRLVASHAMGRNGPVSSVSGRGSPCGEEEERVSVVDKTRKG